MPIANVNQWSANGIQYLFWAGRVSGIPQGTTGLALANGSAAGMGRLGGVSSVDIAEPTAEVLTGNGNNGVAVQFLTQPQSLPSGNLTTVIFDQTFNAVSNGTKIEANQTWDITTGFPACFNFADLCMVVNAPAQSQETSTLGESGFEVIELLNVNVHSMTLNSIANNTIREYGAMLTLKRSSTHLSGVAFTASVNGSTSGVVRKYVSSHPVTYHTLIGDGAVSTIVLDETPAGATANDVVVYKDGTKLAYTTDYTVDTTTKTVTLVVAPTAGQELVVWYKFLATC